MNFAITGLAGMVALAEPFDTWSRSFLFFHGKISRHVVEEGGQWGKRRKYKQRGVEAEDKSQKMPLLENCTSKRYCNKQNK